MLTSLKSCRSPCTWHCHHAAERETPRVYPSRDVAIQFARFESGELQHLGILQERVYRSQIHDVNELKERLFSEWRLLDHIIIAAAAIAQWRSRWMHVFAWMVDILNINFEPLTFCCVLFVSSILVPLNMIDINMCKVLIVYEMCYFCVWDFYTVW